MGLFGPCQPDLPGVFKLEVGGLDDRGVRTCELRAHAHCNSNYINSMITLDR